MAKKTPLILSTLTLLASGLAPASVWAENTYSFEGPWSFDEMMSVESEIQPIIDEVCPYETWPENCAQRYTIDRYAEAPIYNRVVTFEDAQFHILLLDSNPSNGKTTIEYYFNPENSYEKYTSPVRTDYGNVLRKYFDPVFYTHTIHRIHIYQSETGYSAGSLDEPGFKTLYFGTKSEGEESLLPANQKGTLEIEEVSFDPKYRRWIFIDFEDENGRIHRNWIDFSGCHQGGELCKMQYAKDIAQALLVNKPTYEEGYADGYRDGLADGQNAGYAAGFEDGYINGENDGYDSGFIDGVETGRTEGYDNGHEDGYNEGYNSGLNQGRIEGYEYGRMLGRDEGYTDGYNDGLNDGYAEGQDAGYHTGYDNGYNNGYNNGYTSGYNATSHNAEDDENSGNDAANNTDDSSAEGNDPSTDNTTNTNQATNGEISINNTSTLSVGSELASSIKSRFSAKTPNTGSPTGEEYSVEFPWWLGAIFAVGVITVIWLFIPNHKKTNKKS